MLISVLGNLGSGMSLQQILNNSEIIKVLSNLIESENKELGKKLITNMR